MAKNKLTSTRSQAPSLKKIAFIPDVHVPAHDKRAVALVLQALRWWRPRVLFIKGDFVNCGSVSPHVKSPRLVPQFLDQETEAANALLDQFDALGATEKNFVQGNHEYWIERLINAKVPELEGMISLEKELRLKERGWTYTPYRQSRLQGKVYVTHECGQAGAQAHIRAIDAFQDNVIIAHTHHMGVHYSGSAKGKSHVGAVFGWLGDVNQVDYMHRVQALRGWQLGFGIGYQEANGTVHVQAVPIIDYKCVVDGKLFRG